MSNFFHKSMYQLMALVNFKRSANLANLVLPFIKEGERVLDLGGRTGDVAKYINDRRKVQITLLDLTDEFSKTNFKIEVYDGKKIPYPNGYFDCVLVFFVLHHSDSPDLTLEEVVRISKNKIIIFEDIFEGKVGFFLTQAWDRLVCFLGGDKGPFNFRSDKQWKKQFKKLRLKIHFSKEVRFPFWRPTNQKLYVLVKKTR